ncbi:hypothetical protein FA13DRAFT_1787323 [Coprinellus micaceus]|uniref:Transmembrane protein n=1 Tax=Coprinellus micaceus TaxID=71717 RepID=A0A4Y7TNT5_COPMI|nr:hypothetical protein FA13DRAFT_1787323 [Coprinellus micaceus]
MKFWTLPNIEYPATHEFEGKLFNRLTYAAAFLALVILAIVNVAVVGYEPTVVLSSNFNDTQTFWFHNFTRPPQPGTLCDRRVFNVGESLVTNASIFEWKIIAITRPNAGKSGVAYDGSVLNNCDIVQMNFYGDIRTWSIEITAYSACRGQDNLEVVASTSMSFSPLPARRGPLLRNVQFSSTDPVSVNLMDMFLMATEDVGLRGWTAFLESNRTGTVAISLSANTAFCPLYVGRKNGTFTLCAVQAPPLNLTATCAVGENFDLMQDNSFGPSFGPPYELDDTLRPPISNILHLALAAMRVDLGNPSPNNILTHPDALNQTLTAVFPQTTSTVSMPSKLYTYLHEQSLLVSSESGTSVFDPFRIPGPSVVQAVYVCKFLKRKDLGNLIVSVMVATLGMFTTAWTVFIFVACWILNRRAERAGHGGPELPGNVDPPLPGSKPSAHDEEEKTLSLVSTIVSTSPV